MIGQPIKIAGILTEWDADYAQRYSHKLQEMDYYTRIVEHPVKPTVAMVAYSHRPFTQAELDLLVVSLFADN